MKSIFLKSLSSICFLALSLVVSSIFTSNVIATEKPQVQMFEAEVEAKVKTDNGSSKAEKNFINKLQALGVFSSKYEQSLSDKNGKLLEQAKGEFFLGNNRAFKNKIMQPDDSLIISDGVKLWMMDNDLEQVTVNFLDDFVEGSPLQLLLGSPQAVLKDFAVSEKISNQSGSQATMYFLKAKSPQSNVLDVRVAFKGSAITFIELDQISGNRARINFLNFKTLKLSKKELTELFSITIPEIFDVVDETI